MSDALFRQLAREDGEFRIERYCFQKQVDFLRDPHRFKVLVCTRRAGKTEMVAADMLDQCVHPPLDARGKPIPVRCVYVAETREWAKRIMWDRLLDLAKRHGIRTHVNSQQLVISFDNGSKIYIAGAKDEPAIKRLAGQSYKRVYLDEAADFGVHFERLVTDILTPTLADESRNPGGGQMCMVGTPGEPRGPFYEAATGLKPGWHSYAWSMDDNPFIRDPEEERRQFRDQAGVTEDDPSYRRMMRGEWVYDEDSLVFQFSPSVNLYDELPTHVRVGNSDVPIPEGAWRHIAGVDFGSKDATSVVVIAFCDMLPTAFVVHEEAQSGLNSLDEIAALIRRALDRFKPFRTIGDTGGLGLLITSDLATRHGIYIEPKPDWSKVGNKAGFCTVVNADLRSGNLRLHRTRTPVCISDMGVVKWATKNDPTAARKWSRETHSDVLDALMYALHAATHFRARAPEVRPPPGTPEYFQKEADRIEADAERMFGKRGEVPWWDDSNDEGFGYGPGDDSW